MIPASASLTTSRNRRRTRLRTTAFPTFLETVKPTRTAPASGRIRNCKMNPAVGAFCPLAAARKSARCRNRSMWRLIRRSNACDRVNDALKAPVGRRSWPCACGSHGGVCAPACWVDRSASRVLSPFAVACGLYGGLPEASMRPIMGRSRCRLPSNTKRWLAHPRSFPRHFHGPRVYIVPRPLPC